MMNKILLMCVLGSLSISSQAFADQKGPIAKAPFKFGRTLHCPNPLLPVGAAFQGALLKVGANPTTADLSWALNAMRTSGFPANPLVDDRAIAAGKITSWLAKGGNIVSAKAHNDFSRNIPGYKSFSESIESFLTVLTQPIAHSSHDSRGSNPDELDQASNRLQEVISRAHASSNVMGALYKDPSVRLYLLAHGFQDEVGVLVLTNAVCRLNLNFAAIEKLNVSARFMAMPFKSIPQQKN